MTPLIAFQRKMIFLMTYTIDFIWADIPLSEVELLNCIKDLEDKETTDMAGFFIHLLKKVNFSLFKPLKHIF
jgi:hypothetical protein